MPAGDLPRGAATVIGIEGYGPATVVYGAEAGKLGTAAAG